MANKGHISADMHVQEHKQLVRQSAGHMTRTRAACLVYMTWQQMCQRHQLRHADVHKSASSSQSSRTIACSTLLADISQ